MYLHIQEAGAAPAASQPLRPHRPTLDEIQSDIGHLYELLDVLFDAITELDVPGPAKSRPSALAWIARDIAERAVADFDDFNTPSLIKANGEGRS